MGPQQLLFSGASPPPFHFTPVTDVLGPPQAQGPGTFLPPPSLHPLISPILALPALPSRSRAPGPVLGEGKQGCCLGHQLPGGVVLVHHLAFLDSSPLRLAGLLGAGGGGGSGVSVPRGGCMPKTFSILAGKIARPAPAAPSPRKVHLFPSIMGSLFPAPSSF